jgi:hypothetical protein
MDLPTMRTLVRQDLHDEDSAGYRWTDDELDRHIGRAVKELSLAVPLESKASLTTTAGSRELSLSSLADLVVVEAVEYPVGKYPPAYVSFSLWADTLTLLVDRAPLEAEGVDIFYGAIHTLDATLSTIPSRLEELVATGAAAYAALEWASFATNRVNVGGVDTWRQYLVWGQERMAAFAQGLAKHGRRARVRVQQLYSPAGAADTQSTVWQP